MPGIKRVFIPKIGAVKEIFSQTVFYMSILNFIMIGFTAYNTTLRPYIVEYFDWMQAWMFILILFVILIIGMFIEYIFIMPSYYSFRGKQYSEHSQWNGKKEDNITEEQLKKAIREVLDERGRNNLSSKPSK